MDYCDNFVENDHVTAKELMDVSSQNSYYTNSN